jgi:hypothetical protein
MRPACPSQPAAQQHASTHNLVPVRAAPADGTREADACSSAAAEATDAATAAAEATAAAAPSYCFFLFLLRVPRRCEMQLAASCALVAHRVTQPPAPAPHMQRGRAAADEAHALTDTPKSWGGKPTPRSRTVPSVSASACHTRRQTPSDAPARVPSQRVLPICHVASRRPFTTPPPSSHCCPSAPASCSTTPSAASTPSPPSSAASARGTMQ